MQVSPIDQIFKNLENGGTCNVNNLRENLFSQNWPMDIFQQDFTFKYILDILPPYTFESVKEIQHCRSEQFESLYSCAKATDKVFKKLESKYTDTNKPTNGPTTLPDILLSLFKIEH